jgi:hypothetical protein
MSKSSTTCVQTNHRKEQVFIVYVATQIIFIQKWKKTSLSKLVGCNTNELKAVTHVTSHGQYSNVVAHKTKEREIIQHVFCST